MHVAWRWNRYAVCLVTDLLLLAAAMRIDSHHHLWDYSPEQYDWIPAGSALAQDYTADDIANVTKAAGIDHTVLVQARQTLEETDAILQIAADSDVVSAVVGWVPLAAANIGSILDGYADEPALRAVRHVVQGEPDGFLDGKEFNSGIRELKSRGLVYDVLIFGRQLEEATRFVDRHPEQPFVLDHIAKPTIKAGQFDEAWAKSFRELAKRDNLTCKFSGVVTEVRDDGWNIDLVRPYWDAAIEAFGPERLMFGTDWPVCRLKCEYGDWVKTVEELAKGLSASEQTAFWSKTATQAYGLKFETKKS